ncbi:hypothetical protein AWENTII_009924 [Aspergillus wentii]
MVLLAKLPCLFFPNLDPSTSSANSACSPPLQPADAHNLGDNSYLATPLISCPTSPGASSRSATGSFGSQNPPRNLSVTPNPPAALPSLPRYQGAWESLASSPDNRRAESSVYYTTAWGSPYAAPSPRRLSWSLSQYASIDRESGASSPTSIRSGIYHGSETNQTEFLRPSAADTSFRNLRSVSRNRSPVRDLLGRKGGKSIKDFTQDWINQYLSGQPRTEKSNWLSDDSGSEAPSFFTAQNHFADDPSDDWLGLEDDNREEDILRTPTLADFVNRRKVAGQGESAATQRVKDYLHKRTETLRQEDFWGFAYDKDPQPITMAETKDTPLPPEPGANKTTSPTEKPLPPPPVEDENAGPSPSQPSEASNSKPIKKPAMDKPSRPVRKKIAWRGKACIIALPMEDNRGSEESGYRLLTRADMAQRLKSWEDEGYDIRGFNVSTTEDPAGINLGGASRPLFPDSSELQDGKIENYTVRFPNKGEWDAYVNFLQEEKLRALGVSLGDEEAPPSVSPAASMNQMAPFPGLVSSPPIPTASAASNPLGVPHHPFSPQFNQSAPGSNGIGSLASPASQFGVQPPFFGVDQNLLGGYPVQFQPTPPAQGSLTPQSFFNARQSGAASALSGALPNMTSMLSPVSPMNEHGVFHPGLNDGPGPSEDGFDGRFNHDTQDHIAAGQSLRPIRTPTETPDNFHSSNVEIAHPTPRGHSRGHNLSETLQKGLDQIAQSDYHLEASIQRQLEEDDRHLHGSEMLKSRWAIPDNNHHPIHDPHHFYGGNYAGDNGHEGSDIDTNPSLTGTPHHGPLANNIPWHEPKPSNGSFVPGHHSKFSSSSFNVEAKEFDPMASFASQNFPFQNNTFQVPGMEQPGFGFAAGPGFKPALPQTDSFNVTAPAFTPGGMNGQNNAGSGEFKFSSASFNVAAPAFNPSSSIASDGSQQPPSGKTKIFGDVDYSEASKPSKKSKAIPIVRPDENEETKDENEPQVENDNGRPIPTDRHKRARRGDERSDGETQVSIPNALAETKNIQASHASNPSQPPAAGKENAAPEKETDTPDAKPIPVPDDRDGKATPVSEASTWAAPAETKDEGETAQPHLPEQGQPESEAAVEKEPESEKQPTQDEVPATVAENKPTEEEASKDSQKKPMLSATAQPFQFKPAVREFVPTTVEDSKPTPEEPIKKNDLMASRYAVASPPPTLSKDKPLPPPPAQSDNTDIKDHAPDATEPQSEHVSGDEVQQSLNEDELNAVMEQLNDGSDVGIERLSTPHPKTRVPDSVVAPSKEKKHAPAEIRSEAPSPSPGRGLIPHMLNVPKLTTDFDADSQASASPQKGFISGMHSPIRQLINENDHISDWDDVISSGEDEKLANRSRFFDRRVNDLVGSAVDERLSPLERALGVIQQAVESIASGVPNRWRHRSTSAEIEDSDADDEDDEYDENESYRARSPIRPRDRKFDKLKKVLLEALETRDSSNQVAENPTATELAQLRESFAELQALTTQKLSQDPTENLKTTIQEVISTQLSQQNARPSEADEIGADSLMLQIDGLKSMLRLADERAEQEYKLRREAQDSMAELQGLLKASQEDAARHSEAAESAETRLLHLKEEKLPYFEKVQSQTDSVNQDNETLKLTLTELSAKNISLQGTIDEHRVSSDHYKRESEQWKQVAEASQEENKNLRGNIEQFKVRLEDGMNARQNLTEKFDRLQEEMVNVTRDIARDQAASRRREEEHIAKFNELRASYAREVKLREKLDNDIAELEQQEREAAKLKFIFGQSQQENARLEELVANLRVENHDLTIKAARFEREFNEARESSRVEIQRTRTSFEADLEAANSQVNIVRAELETQIIRLQSQLDSVKLDADTSQERYEMLLEEAKESKATAVAAAVGSKELAIEDHRSLHERVLNDLRERHARALHNSSEDRARGEAHLMDRLALSDEKVVHLQDRVNHLEEKLEIAKSAARAAAEAAQNAKTGPSAPALAHASSPSMSFDKGSTVPEKISPQALRESILVLQDQLQQRETRIDELEQEVSSIDKDAPNKLNEKDTEINWLRELLGVRIDDLQDIIKTVSQPSFDHNAVRDAAIRLRANLQMQQQERERSLSGQGFPSFPSISEMTASPRSLPLAAAAAWGNWRKGKDNSEQTPSKASNAGAFLSGLLTPPASNLRQAPSNGKSPAGPAWRRSSEGRPLRSFNSTPRPLSARQGSSIPEPPSTPPLLRKSSYDHDAEPTNYEQDTFGDDGESTAGDLVSASPKDTGDVFHCGTT